MLSTIEHIRSSVNRVRGSGSQSPRDQEKNVKESKCRKKKTGDSTSKKKIGDLVSKAKKARSSPQDGQCWSPPTQRVLQSASPDLSDGCASAINMSTSMQPTPHLRMSTSNYAAGPTLPPPIIPPHFNAARLFRSAF